MTRTASIGSRVPPGGDEHLTPARSPGPSSRSTAATIAPARPAGRRRRRRRPAGRVRARHVHAPAAQRRQVLLHRRVLPHLGVHRRADDHRRPGGEQRGRQQVATRCRRRTRRSAGPSPATTTTRSARWPSRVCGIGSSLVPQRGAGRLGGQRRERRDADEALGALGHHRASRGRRRRPGDGRPRWPCRRRCRR